jgi:hypothetical protein
VAGAEVVDQREAMPSGDGSQLAQGRSLLEPHEPEVRLVDAQEQRGVGADRGFVVRGARPVRRAHLDEARARPREHVGDPESVPDLDQLPAGDDHLPPLRERGEREQHRGGVVVDDERRLGAGEPAQDPGAVLLARAARPARQVVLQVRVAAARLAHSLERRVCQGRPSQVRVHDDAGRVQHPPEARAPRVRELRAEAGGEVARIQAGTDLTPRSFDKGTRRLHRQRVVGLARELVHGRKVAKSHVRQV